MTPVPRSALVLTAAGVIPFLWGVATELSPALADFAMRWIGPRFIGPYVGLAYGTVILAFMAGALWGFATKARGQAGVFYALSVVPALWAFVMVGGGPVMAAIWLAAGFVGILGLDWLFLTQGLAPRWWLRLRLPVTAIVVACILLPVLLNR